MTTKTIFGLDFPTLHSGNSFEIVDAVVGGTLDQIRENLEHNNAGEVFVNLMLTKGRPLLQQLFTEVFTDSIIAGMQKLYDTEDRFDLAADMQTSMGNIGIRIQPTLTALAQQIEAELQH